MRLGRKSAGYLEMKRIAVSLKEIGDENGDFVWPMPLVDAYEAYLTSDYADMSNISSKGEAGSITAGLFLRRFVPKNAKWLHVDMAGVMESSQASGYYPKTATGYGARLLADFTTHISNKTKTCRPTAIPGTARFYYFYSLRALRIFAIFISSSPLQKD